MRPALVQGPRAAERRLAFKSRDFRGSRFRCLLATSLDPLKFAEWMNQLVKPFAQITDSDQRMPNGFSQPDEAKLGEPNGFLSDKVRAAVNGWWLEVPEDANTPNWDMVSKCKIDGRDGLILVEAKAHAHELHPHDECGACNEQNRKKIAQAIEEASNALGKGWSLAQSPRYQLSNRFAWAWKIASLGVPVILMYLAFLNANEMDHAFHNHRAWEQYFLEYAKNYVPESAWNSTIMVKDTALIPIFRSATVNVIAT